MHLYCPSCHSPNIKKNGYTHYGKQNHQCKDCGRQFVLNNTHTKSEYLKSLVLKSLKERLSLRATCRVFGVSLNWLLAFTRVNWNQTPKDLGLDKKVIGQIKKL